MSDAQMVDARDRFQHWATVHGQRLVNPDSTVTEINEAFDAAWLAYDELMQNDQEGKALLEPLLQHDDLHVRYMAANGLARFDNERFVIVFQQIERLAPAGPTKALAGGAVMALEDAILNRCTE